MSVCANIYCLFRVAPSPERVMEVRKVIWNRLGYEDDYQHEDVEYGFLKEVFDADLYYEFADDGLITRLDRPRHGALIGDMTRQGRFFEISYLTRFWSEVSPQGPMPEYIITLLTLLMQPDIAHVWFAPDEWRAKEPLSCAQVYKLLDDYIRIGQE